MERLFGILLQCRSQRRLGLCELPGAAVEIGDPAEDLRVLRRTPAHPLDQRRGLGAGALLAQQHRLEAGEVDVVGEPLARGAHGRQRFVLLLREIERLGVEAKDARVRLADRLGTGEGGGRVGMALALLLGEAEVQQEHPVARSGLAVRGVRPGEQLLDQRCDLDEVPPRFGDRDLEEGGLDVARVAREQRVGHGIGLVVALEVAQAASFDVEGEAVAGVLLQDGLGFGERLFGTLGLLEHLSEREPDPHVARLDLQRLPEVQHRLVGLLRPGVDVAEELVRTRLVRP